MQPKYYQQVSPLGKPILELLPSRDYLEDFKWWQSLEIARSRLADLYAYSPIIDPLQDGKSALQLIGVMGSDLDVVNDARASFNKSSPNFDTRDEKLLNYLSTATPPHSSPFRGSVLKFRISAPIFVCRQFVKHAVASCHLDDQYQHNEASFRYLEITEPQFYLPTTYRSQSDSNRQASGEDLDSTTSLMMRELFDRQYLEAYTAYKTAIASGVAREQARMLLPAAIYTTWTWTVSLQALLNFIQLRKGVGAQAEIVAYADAIEVMLTQLFPHSTKVWLEK